MSLEENPWLRRVSAIDHWSRGGERAPHKPLLLLYAIGRLQQTGSASVSFDEAEAPLRRLLEEFGPPRRTSPGYRFHYLTSDAKIIASDCNDVGAPRRGCGAELRSGRETRLVVRSGGDGLDGDLVAESLDLVGETTGVRGAVAVRTPQPRAAHGRPRSPPGILSRDLARVSTAS